MSTEELDTESQSYDHWRDRIAMMDDDNEVDADMLGTRASSKLSLAGCLFREGSIEEALEYFEAAMTDCEQAIEQLEAQA